MLRLVIAVIMIWFASAGAACGKAGSKQFPVRLHSVPDGAIAYVVPYSDWLKAGEREAMSDDDFLERYRITSGRTPVIIKRHPYDFVFIAERDSSREVSERFVPGRESDVTVRLE